MMKWIFSLLLLFTSLWGNSHEALFEALDVANAAEAHLKWYQKGDRWTFEDRYEERRDEILPLLEALGYFEAKEASKTHYDYAVVLGALHAAVQKRIDHLIAEYNRGVRFDTIVFLTGMRPVHPEKEMGFTGTETTVMIQVWNTTPMSEELRTLPLIIIDALPLPQQGRPTTESTLLAWLEENPKPGSCLFFSSQPHVICQDTIIRYVLPSSFEIETIGPEGGRNLPLAVLLDTIARGFYWSDLLLQKDLR